MAKQEKEREKRKERKERKKISSVDSSLSLDEVNLKDKDAMRMNNNPSYAGESGEYKVNISGGYKASTKGMTSGNTYYDLGKSVGDSYKSKRKNK